MLSYPRGQNPPHGTTIQRQALRYDGLHERKRQLNSLISTRQHLLYCDHLDERGEDLFRFVCENDLEGIVAKPRNSPYLFSASETYWLKIKNRE